MLPCLLPLPPEMGLMMIFQLPTIADLGIQHTFYCRRCHGDLLLSSRENVRGEVEEFQDVRFRGRRIRNGRSRWDVGFMQVSLSRGANAELVAFWIRPGAWLVMMRVELASAPRPRIYTKNVC